MFFQLRNGTTNQFSSIHTFKYEESTRSLKIDSFPVEKYKVQMVKSEGKLATLVSWNTDRMDAENFICYQILMVSTCPGLNFNTRSIFMEKRD
ncbi:unnamed protein product [Gordionus sp. m RMFG-2023]